MSLTLHLGVIDIPYSTQKKGMTTGDVATILEDKYHVKRIFFELHAREIAGYLEEGLKGELENLLVGGPVKSNLFDEGCGKIDDRFKQFLSRKEMDALGYPGVPTKAALKGVSHRMKRPYKGRGPRPSFIDTTLYQDSTKSWVD